MSPHQVTKAEVVEGLVQGKMCLGTIDDSRDGGIEIPRAIPTGVMTGCPSTGNTRVRVAGGVGLSRRGAWHVEEGVVVVVVVGKRSVRC